MRVEYRVLGPFEVRRGDEPVRLPTGNERALLAMLLLHANEPVSSDRLIDALWGESPPPSAAKMVQIYISRLRQRLDPEPASDADDGGAVLVTHAGGYQLRVVPGTSDLDEFGQLRREGTRALASGHHARALAKLSQALALWRGPALADFSFAAFAQQEIARLDDLRLATLEDRIEAELALGRHADLVGELKALVAANPLRERLRGQLILALYRAGQQADALAEYRETRRMLVGELGIEPGAELQELERAILRHDPALDQGAPIAPPATDGDGATYVVERGRSRARRRARLIAAATVPLGIVALVLAIRAVTSSSEAGAVQVAANGVGVIDDGKLVAAGTLPASPTDIAVGAGSVWVTSADGHTVSRVDPDSGRVQQTIRVGSGASGVAADDRAVWVANSLDGTVSRIDPRTDTVVQTIAVGSAPVAIALARGAVWVASKDEQTLSRLDARTGFLTARVAVGAGPRAVAVGAGGVWVADEVRGVVFRVDPARKTVVETISVGNGPTDIAIGAGAVWVANNLDGTVSRIDPRRASVTATIAVGDGPRGIVVVGDGVWVSNEFDGMLTLIDQRTNAVTRSVLIGQRPQGLAAASPRLFVAVRSAGSAHRGGTLRIVGEAPYFRNSIDTLNIGAWSATISTNDGLVAFRRVGGAGGNQLVPNLALALPTPSDGGRTYTFRLRAGIRYSNGAPVEPVDFRRALERNFLVFHEAAPYSAIVGASECAATPASCDLSRGIVTDERARTVTFHLRTPDPDFLHKLALPYAYAVPAATAARDVGTHPLPATGPYMIARFRPRRELTLVRNPRFREWSKAAQPDGYPDRITLRLGVEARPGARRRAGGRRCRVRRRAARARERGRHPVRQPGAHQPPSLGHGSLPQHEGAAVRRRARAARRQLRGRSCGGGSYVCARRGGPAHLPDPAAGLPRLSSVLSLHPASRSGRGLDRARPRAGAPAGRRLGNARRRGHRLGVGQPPARGPARRGGPSQPRLPGSPPAGRLRHLLRPRGTGELTTARSGRARLVHPRLSRSIRLPQRPALLRRIQAWQCDEPELVGVLRSSDRRVDPAGACPAGDRSVSRQSAVGTSRPRDCRPGAVRPALFAQAGGLRLPAGGQLPVPPAVGHPAGPALGALERDHVDAAGLAQPPDADLLDVPQAATA